MMKTPQPPSKKIKVGTTLDEDILRRLKERAAREGRTIAALIEEAVLKLGSDEAFSSELRMRALDNFLSIQFNIPNEDWKTIMEEDYYDQ
jgi:predicted DNA-binding ribbon-helix-helix protein